MSVLVDTSIWISYLRTGPEGPAAPLDGLLASRQVLICGPVAAELLAGTSTNQRAELWSLLTGLEWADLRRDHWREVGETAATLRGQGRSVPLTDVEIAVAATGSRAKLWTDDTHFDRIGQILAHLERYQP